jgi:hypothetical protein
MAEERNLGVARAEESTDTDSTKAELQRRMEEARESITQTVTEIKDTVANQYQAVRDTVTEALDWREQFRKRPVAFSIGALSAGFIVGYAVAGTFADGDADSEYTEDNYPSYEESDAYSTTGAAPAKLSSSPYAERGLARPASAPAASAPAPQAAASKAYDSTRYEQSSVSQALMSVSDSGTGAEEAESDKPGLIDRFKETRAYDKLQEEVSALGDRFIEELSSVGRNVVLPALFSKVKDLFGVDLANTQGGRSAAGTGSSAGRSQSGVGSGSTGAGSTSGGAGGGTGTGASSGASSYATSENQSYQTPSTGRA